jgi:hypothetical protein
MHSRASRSRAVPALVAVVLLATGCAPASTSPSTTGTGTMPPTPAAPSPTRTPVAGLDWRAATDVARPEDAFPTGEPSEAPPGPGTAGHPGHFPGQATIADAVVLGDRIVSVGYVGWDWRAGAWVTMDGDHWTYVEMGGASTTVPTFAVAVGALPGDGGVVAVGRSGPRPFAWTSEDGEAWTAHSVPVLGGPSDQERMTAVATGPRGVVAGGSVGPELFERRARFWTSNDGSIWTPAPDDPAFDGAEVTAFLPLAGGWLAIGRLGSGQRTTGSVAWRSTDGVHWTRIDDPALSRGYVRAVARSGDGSIVAVGSDLDETAAWVWRSADDGATWILEPDEDSRTWFGNKIRMTDVITTPDGLLAVGNHVGVQYGTGESWLSSDASSWTHAPAQPVMGQVEPSAVVGFEDRYVMVGTFGAPDDYIPRAWISPPGD